MLTENEDLKYQLETLASYEKDQLEDTEIEVCYEDKNGMEGFARVELMGLGDRALKRIEQLETQYQELSDYTNKIKASSVNEFVNLMIGALSHGFVDKNNPTLAEIYQVARHHVKYNYGVELPSIVDMWGKETAKECGLQGID